MAERVTATLLARNLSDLLNRVRYRGERFIIERNGEPVAELGPAPGKPATTVRDVLELLQSFEVDDGFADDLEAIQEEQPAVPGDPWLRS